MPTTLVTGGAGFIGCNIVRELIRQGQRPRVIDNFFSGKRENLAEVLDQIDLIEGDITNPGDLKRACEGVDFISHQGAIPSVPRSVADPKASTYANVNGSLELFLAARDAGVKRIVCASSSSVYGKNPILPKHEEMLPMPVSPYAASKLAMEAYARACSAVYDMQIVCLRYFNVFGPRQDPKSQYAAVIPRFVTAMHQGQAPTIYGDGEQSRDFSYVENVISANLLALQADGPVAGEAMNIACGEQASLNDLVRMLNEILGTDVTPIYEPERVGDVKHSLASIDKARALIGYEPKVLFREGLEKAVEWYTRGQ
jgi:nucleoside-diphosphate-sugar epimerase